MSQDRVCPAKRLAITFLDSSTILEYLRGTWAAIDYLDTGKPWWTLTICVFEVLKLASSGIPAMRF